MKGVVLKIIAGKYYVLIDNKTMYCEIRSTVKKKIKVLVGDYVDCHMNDYDKGNGIIGDIFDRKNSLIRPPIANLDQLLVVVAKEPLTDFLLVDKLIIYCFQNNIEPILVINKSDLYTLDEINNIKNDYQKVVKDIIVTNAKNNTNIELIKKLLKNKITAVAGQSAVGKSTILNAIDTNLKLRTNDLSDKLNCGKHTTRNSEIFVIAGDILIADTPGFSLLDLEIDKQQLPKFYPEFDKYANKCKFQNCSHINEKESECAVKIAITNSELSLNRYNRYVLLYKDIKDKY